MNTTRFFRLEALAALCCAALSALSAVWPDWIERLTGLEPDAGDGSAEWGLVIGFALAAIALGVLARVHGKRLARV